MYMKTLHVALALAVVAAALPLFVHMLTLPSPGCIEGTLDAVDTDARTISVSGTVLDVRGWFYEGNTVVTSWDLLGYLQGMVGSRIRVCYDEEGKVEEVYLNDRVWRREEHD